MAKLLWSDIEHWLNPLLKSPLPLTLPAPQPADLSTNSREIKPGQWFLPLQGEVFDGHSFIADALGKGAVGFFYAIDRQASIPPVLLSQGIAVSATLAALQAFAQGWRKSLTNVTVFALTGSVGKTTCKEILAHILGAGGSTHFSRGNLNNEIGVPLSLLQLQSHHQFSVIEMGARQPGDIAKLVSIVEPHVVACLNAYPVHVAIFGSLDQVVKTKLEIIAPLTFPNKSCIFADQKGLLEEAQKIRSDLITFGTNPHAMVKLDGANWRKDGGMDISIAYGAELLSLSVSVAHDTYPLNITAACAMAFAAGIKTEQIIAGMKSFAGVSGRFLIHRTKHLIVIDDAYNANPQSMAAGLRSLSRSFPHQQKVVVLGDMLELGETARYEHQRIGELCQTLVQPTMLFTVGELAQALAEGAKAAGLAHHHHRHFAKVEDLLAANLDFASLGEVLYAKASRGIKLDKLVTFLKTN